MTIPLDHVITRLRWKGNWEINYQLMKQLWSVVFYVHYPTSKHSVQCPMSLNLNAKSIISVFRDMISFHFTSLVYFAPLGGDVLFF